MFESKEKYSDIPLIIIDKGTFKYVLLSLVNSNSSNNDPIYFIRGDCSSEYHVEVIGSLHQQLLKMGLYPKICGGGRIHHDPLTKEIKIYGYSVQYGQPDHSITARLLEKMLSGYKITFSNEGY